VARRSSLTICSAFLRAAARAPSRVAIRFEGREIAYGELERDSARLANALLRAVACRPGERVGLLIGNRPEFLVAVLAVARAGLVAVPLPSGSTARELSQVAEDSGMRALLVAEEPAGRLAVALEELSSGGIAVHGTDGRVGGTATTAELLRRASTAPVDLAREDEPFFFGYTSGTTGRPKAAVVSHRARTLLALMYGQEYGCYAPDETHLITTPMYHGAGLGRALAPLLTGGTIDLHRRFDPERVLSEIAAGAVTATFMVPTMFASIFELPAPALGRGGGRLRTVLSNASALPEHLKHRILEQWPSVRLFEIYGSTETGTVSSLRPEDLLRKPRCVGLPLALTQVRLVREDGEEAGEGEVGTLYCSSPYLFEGYHGNPEATDAVTLADHVTAGDLARRDEEGYLYIVGRIADVIVSGGVNVYPREVEEYLTEHPGVGEAVVFGVPDPHWGEAVHAVVVPSADAPPPTQEELIVHCRLGLAGAKIPKSVSVRSSLPRTPTGKVLKRELAAELTSGAGGHEQGAGRAEPKGARDGERV
jgi:acyl-CoA synthetase (AMP-forming)/AMP-acid ligase II